MADFRFLHLGVNFEKDYTNEKREQLEVVLNQARDWFRYAPNCWLIYTSVSAKTWHERFKKEIPWITGESYLIAPINVSQKSGWLRQSAWEWINKNRE